MPQMPDAPSGPNIEIDIDAKHIVELVDMDEIPTPFPNKPKGAMSIIWKFYVFNQQTGEQIMDLTRGEEWEHWGFTPDGTWRNEKSGDAAKARLWTEALIGRQLSDGEMADLIRTGFKESLMRKKAIADFEWYTDKNGNTRPRIMRMRPLKATNGAVRQPVAVAAASIPEDGVRYDQEGNEFRGETKDEKKARLLRELEEADAA